MSRPALLSIGALAVCLVLMLVGSVIFASPGAGLVLVGLAVCIGVVLGWTRGGRGAGIQPWAPVVALLGLAIGTMYLVSPSLLAMLLGAR